MPASSLLRLFDKEDLANPPSTLFARNVFRNDLLLCASVERSRRKRRGFVLDKTRERVRVLAWYSLSDDGPERDLAGETGDARCGCVSAVVLSAEDDLVMNASCLRDVFCHVRSEICCLASFMEAWRSSSSLLVATRARRRSFRCWCC